MPVSHRSSGPPGTGVTVDVDGFIVIAGGLPPFKTIIEVHEDGSKTYIHVIKDGANVIEVASNGPFPPV
jgi:hypothetical protein